MCVCVCVYVCVCVCVCVGVCGGVRVSVHGGGIGLEAILQFIAPP